MDGTRVGILGGTFDPPHVAHLILAEVARSQLSLERVVFVPAGDPWRKAQREVTPASHRLAMLRLAVATDPYFEVSEIEVKRKGPSYTVDTLSILRENLAPRRPTSDEEAPTWASGSAEPTEASVEPCELYFILGEDALHDLPNWKEPGRIVELAWLAVAPRLGTRQGRRQLVTEGLERALPGIRERVILLDMPVIDISATWLRQRARSGGSLRYLVPLAVEEYIRRHGLYLQGEVTV